MLLSNLKRASVVVILLSACLASAEIIGNQNVGSSSSSTAKRSGQRFAVTENGTINSVTIYHAGTGSQVIVAVYADNAGAPGALISRSSIQAASTTAGWQTVPLDGSAPISEGAYVWLAWFFQNAPGTKYVSGSGCRYNSSYSWPAGATAEVLMPSSFGTTSSLSRLYSVYATYTPDPGASPEGWSTLNGVTSTDDHVGIGTTDLYRKLTVEAGPTDLYALSVRNGAFGALEVSSNSAVAMVVNGGQSQFWDDVMVSGELGLSGNLYMSMGNIELQSGTLKIKNWTIEAPDYVFEKDYKLPSLTAVEKHIAANKHLPGVPSAAEMKEKGVDLSEMNMTLLKKVEELTLYAIEQNKKIEALERRVEEK
jgi:hypothetical protein